MDGLRRAEEKGLGHGRVSPGHSPPAAASRRDAGTATGWSTKREEGSECQVASGVGGNGPVYEAARVRVGAGDEGKRRGRAAEPRWLRGLLQMVTWVWVERKVWLLVLDKRSSQGDVKVSGGFGAWEQAKLSRKHIQ